MIHSMGTFMKIQNNHRYTQNIAYLRPEQVVCTAGAGMWTTPS